VLYGIGAVDENSLDVAVTTTYTVTGLVNGTAYRFASAEARPLTIRP
jgi:hypothetical protein